MSRPWDDPTNADTTARDPEVVEGESDPIAPLGASSAVADAARAEGAMQPEDEARDDGVPVGRADAEADRWRSESEPPEPQPIP
jgi:hypothetical protein